MLLYISLTYLEFKLTFKILGKKIMRGFKISKSWEIENSPHKNGYNLLNFWDWELIHSYFYVFCNLSSTINFSITPLSIDKNMHIWYLGKAKKFQMKISICLGAMIISVSSNFYFNFNFQFQKKFQFLFRNIWNPKQFSLQNNGNLIWNFLWVKTFSGNKDTKIILISTSAI